MKDLKEKTYIIQTWEAFSFSLKVVSNACGKNLSKFVLKQLNCQLNSRFKTKCGRAQA